jgi:hypothetical protein
VVNLGSGSDAELDGPGVFRHPALAPTGDRIVAEGFSLTVTFVPVDSETNRPDTTVARDGDLYLFTAP